MDKPISSFGGGGKSSTVNSPLSSSGWRGYSTYGANDNARISVDGGGGDSIAAIITAIGQFILAKKQLDIAKDYYNLNERDFNFVANTFGGITSSGVTVLGPLVTHKDQAFATPFYTADYPVPIAGGLARTKVYDDKWFQVRRRAHRYSLGHQRHIDYQFHMMRYRAAFTGLVLGRRVEDARKDWKDEQIQSHKVQALNFGITAGNIARQGLASSVGTAIHAYDEMGSRIGGLANGLGRLGGYQHGTQYGSQQLNTAANTGANLGLQQ